MQYIYQMAKSISQLNSRIEHNQEKERAVEEDMSISNLIKN
jgi:hypothetical protein